MAKTKWARPPVGGPIVIPNCGQIAIQWTENGMTMLNVLHGALTAAGPLNPNVAETIFTAIKAAAATTTWLNHVSATASLSGVRVKDLRAANNPTILSTSAAINGTSAGPVSSQGNALVVTLKTAQSGRGYVGRVYLPGISNDNLADSRHYNSALNAPAVAFLNAINTAMTASGMPWVIGQRALQASPEPGAPPPYNQIRQATTIPITQAAVVSDRIDSQRRRLGRR